MVKESDHYSNVLLLSNNDIPLATISIKKYNWYLKKNLAYDLPAGKNTGYSKILKLNFIPKNISDNKTLTSIKENKCVISGRSDNLTIHHVIPYVVKKYFPLEEKTHTNQWCVLLTEEIHRNIELKTRPSYDLYLCGSQNEITRKKIKGKSEKSEIQKKWIDRLIEDLGGINETKLFYKNLFMKQNPMFLPDGFLEDIK